MYSLGLVLFELCQPFTTESERYGCLANVRLGRLDDEFKQRWPQEVLCCVCKQLGAVHTTHRRVRIHMDTSA